MDFDAKAQKGSFLNKNDILISLNTAFGDPKFLVATEFAYLNKKNRVGLGVVIAANNYKQSPPTDYEPSSNLLSNALFGKQDDFPVSNSIVGIYLLKQIAIKNTKYQIATEAGGTIGTFYSYVFRPAGRQGYSFYGPGSNYNVSKIKKSAVGSFVEISIEYAAANSLLLQAGAVGHFNKHSSYKGLLVGIIASIAGLKDLAPSKPKLN